MLRRSLFTALLVMAPAMAWAQQPCTTDSRRVVDELYRHMLERAPDSGSAGWVNRLESGTTVREIVREIAKSSEHAQRFYNPGEGQVAHERAVATLYRHILGRQPDAPGLSALTQSAMNSGLPAVVDTIVNSREYNQNFGDWGVPGSGGIRYCGGAQASGAQSSAGTSRSMRFPNLDTNRDGVVSRSEWRGTNNAFRVRDWNGDGVLSGDEVRMGANPPDSSLEARDYSMTANDRFDYLDANNNGLVTENEWDGTLDTFDRLDRNRDGRLTRAELGSIRPAAAFATLDANGDGRLTMSEWPWSRRSFIEQDDDSNGVVSRAEYRGAAAAAAR
jgi:Ca2+-binding EF-hand superfamily protein